MIGDEMLYRWVFKKSSPQENISSLQKDHNFNEIIAQLLCDRDLNSPQRINNFFNPSLNKLRNPFEMLDMEKAVRRLITALREGENILIYGDYDVDGITSVSLLYEAIFKLGGKVSFYIPNRITEGYGLSEQGITEAKERNIDLIITVDCGVTAVREVDRAVSLGIDVIICDHHEPSDALPKAHAILNPRRNDCPYKFKELAGVGVAFKFLQGLYTTLGYDISHLEPFLDLVAIGTAADIVPLIDENRILVRFGIEKINNNPRQGIFALMESSSLLGREISVSSIVFVLAPRINAVGRMSTAKKAVHLLTSSSLQQSRNIARTLESENKLRRGIDESTCQEAIDMVNQKIDLEDTKILVLAKENWHPGVIGIVASRITEKFNRPTILISLKDGVGKGSARSIVNFDIYHALNSINYLLDNFGGHKYAAGLTIEEKNIDKLRHELEKISDPIISREELIPTLEIQSEISLQQLDANFLKWLKRFAPYGPQNMRPIFVSRNLEIIGGTAIVGNNHLKLKVKENGIVIDAIAYNFGKVKSEIRSSAQKIDVAYVIEENTWNGQTTVQLRIKDLNLM
jgi:single-stranded-DNA-specific exonuclease